MSPLKPIVAMAVGLLVGASATASAATYDERARQMLELGAVAKNTSGTVAEPKENLYYAMARYAVGKTAEGNQLVGEVLDQREGCAMFCALATQLVYQWFHGSMPAGLQQRLKDFLLTQGATGGTTENHKIMYASSAFISSYTWPEAAAKRAVAKAEIERQVDIILNWGLREDDSPIYMPFYLNSFILLYEFSLDPAIKQKARLALDFLMASAAPEHLTGVWAAATLRDLGPQPNPAAWTAFSFGYLYFNSPYPYRSVRPEVIPCAVSSYRLIHPIIAAATNRSYPFVHRELDRGAAQPGLSLAHKTTFMNRTYALYSDYDGNQTPGWRDQQTRWAVLWPGGKFYLKDEVSGGVGETRYNQVFQNRGVLLGVAVQPLQRHESGIARKFSGQGWEFLQGGEAAFIAYRRFGAAPSAWVVETAARTEFASLEAFRDAIVANARVDASRAAGPKPGLSYTTRDGTRLDITYSSDGSSTDALHYVNGVKVDYANWPLLENPWMSGRANDRLLTMSVLDKRWIYDRDAYTLSGPP